MSFLSISENIENNLINNISELVNTATQENFLESTLGQAVNCAVDIGLKAILPDSIENNIIDIKDTFISQGFNEGINKTIDSAIDIGKGIIGIATGNFENISQAQLAMNKGGLIDGISNVVDFILDKANQAGLISDNITNIISGGKEILLKNINSNIEKEFTNEIKSIEKIEQYSESWKQAFSEENFKNMETNYNKISEEIKKVLPLESVIANAKVIENLHTLIKNNGQDFNLTDEQIALAEIIK